MRFVDLNLQAFGPFTGVTLDLSHGDLGLHVIYGLNEAGKSSALRGIHAALYGIPERTDDNFLHENKQLRVGATLQHSSGEELSFVRRKGRKDTVLNADDSLGPHPDTALDPFLGGVDQSAFARIYGINHKALQRGGEEMRALKGLCGESLFVAGLGSLATGGTGLADVLRRLDDEAAAIYSRKKSSAIKLAKSAYDEAVKGKRDAEVSHTRWQRMQMERDRAGDELNAVRKLLQERRTQASRLERLQQALKPLAERQRLLSELDELGDVTVLPESYSADERSDFQAELEQTRGRIGALNEELEGEGRLRSQITQIEVPEELLENEHVIAGLQQDLGAHLKAVVDRTDELLPRRKELRLQIKNLLRDLAIDEETTGVAALRLASDRRVAIQNFANEEKRLRKAPGELAVQERDLERDMESNRAEHEQLGLPRDTSELERASKRAQKYGDLEERLDDDRRLLNELQRDAEGKLAAFGSWTGTLSQLAELPTPLTETVDRFDGEFAELNEYLKRLKSNAAELDEELGDVRTQIVALEEGGAVPSERELDRCRQQRDHGWELVRRVWLEGLDSASDDVREFTGSLSLADVYEDTVEQADVVADRLRREADRVAHLAERRARQSQLEKRLAAVNGEWDDCRRQREQLAADWREQWTASAILDPLAPREMRGWLERHAELKRLASAIDRQDAQFKQTEGRYAECRLQLVRFLEELGESVPDRRSLGDVLGQARALIQQEVETQRRAAELQRAQDQYQRKLDKVKDLVVQAATELRAWQRQWREAMAQIGCPEDAPAEQANHRISRLDELFQRMDECEGLDDRIRDIDDEARNFSNRVGELVGRLTPELADLPVEQAAKQLQSRLDKARADKVRFDNLAALAEQKQAELDECRREDRQLAQRLAQLCEVAGVEEFKELSQVEQASRQVTQCREQLLTVESRLLELSAGDPIGQLAADAEGRNYDELAASITELTKEIDELDHDREQKAARFRQVENEFQSADGSAAAADADERALGILSRMHTQANDYLRLRLAAAMLRHQIDKYRAANQDPLLARANSLFAHITCREFSGLKTEYGEDDQPVIVGVRQNDELVRVEAMSDGTRDQLYLALRLAYLERRLAQYEPLPLVVDDILIQFDDPRSLATLEVLAELSRRTQVILLTHHKKLVELATANLPDEVFVHELELQRIPAASGQRLAAAGALRPR